MPHGSGPAVRAVGVGAGGLAPQAALAFGALGAVIGGTSSAAQNIRLVKEKRMDREKAVRETVKGALGTGLASAAAAAVVGAVGLRGVLSLAGLLVVATGTQYVWNNVTAAPTAPKDKE